MKKFPLCFSLLSILSASVGFSAERPNILYLSSDDLGWGSIGPNGQSERKADGKPYVLTPNLDRLAAAGVNFRRGYGCTVCSPPALPSKPVFIRAIPLPIGTIPTMHEEGNPNGRPDHGGVLSKAGYATGYWGKWGYGGSKDMQNPALDNIQTLPTAMVINS